MKSLRTLSVFALGTVVCSAALAQSSGEKFIRAYYAKDAALMVKVDFAGLRKHKMDNSTADYVTYGRPDKTGKTAKKTRADEFKGMDQMVPMIESVPKSINHIDHLTLGPTTILVTVTSSGEMRTKKLPQDGKSHTFGGTTTTIDTWVKVGGSWKMKMTKTLSEKVQIDGKSMPGM
jgi:hypothetical protein